MVGHHRDPRPGARHHAAAASCSSGAAVIPASYGGKVKTVLQIAAIVLYILPGVPDPLRWVTMGAAVVVTVATGVDYVVRAIQLRQVARRARGE